MLIYLGLVLAFVQLKWNKVTLKIVLVIWHYSCCNTHPGAKLGLCQSIIIYIYLYFLFDRQWRQMSQNVKCHVMSRVMKCQDSWNVKSHEMSRVMKCQMSWNVKCHEMLMLDLWPQAETPGITHFRAYHRPTDGHFSSFIHPIDNKEEQNCLFGGTTKQNFFHFNFIFP